MLLALSVIGADAARLGLNGYKLFDERGGVIGRQEESDWILRDPQHLVSACHARITHRDHTYFLEDRSSNGTFLNDPGRPVPREQGTRLQDGDRLFIGSFEILVQLIDDLPVMMAGLPQAETGALPEISVGTDGALFSGRKPVERMGRRTKATSRPLQEPELKTEPLSVGMLGAAAGREWAEARLKAKVDARRVPQPESRGDVSPGSRMEQPFEGLLKQVIHGVQEILRAQMDTRQAMQLQASLANSAGMGNLSESHKRVEEAERALVQKWSSAEHLLTDAFTAAFREISGHQAAMMEAMQEAMNAVPAHLNSRRQELWSAAEHDRAKQVRAQFEAVFRKAYARSVERRRVEGGG